MPSATHIARPRNRRFHVMPHERRRRCRVGTVAHRRSVAREVLEHRAEVVVGRASAPTTAMPLLEHGVAELVVAAVGVARLDQHRAALEHDARDVVFARERAPRSSRGWSHSMRMRCGWRSMSLRIS